MAYCSHRIAWLVFGVSNPVTRVRIPLTAPLMQKEFFMTVHSRHMMGRKKALQRRIVLYKRMNILINIAISNAKSNPTLASKQAYIALRLCSRHRIRMPYHLRMLFCRCCKSFIVPGVSSHVRIGGSNIRSIRTTCHLCGFVYRKMLN